MTPGEQVHWESAPYQSGKSARVADFAGMRLYVKRAAKGARHFSFYINGKYQGAGDNIDQACGMCARAARNLLASHSPIDPGTGLV